MFLATTVTFFGVFFYLFLFWRRLKEDYSENIIFNTALYSLAGVLLGVLISQKFLTPYWFWICFFFSFLGVFLGIFRYKLKPLEVIEAHFYSNLPFLSLVFLFDFTDKQRIESLAVFGIMLVLFFIFLYLDRHYKNFSWYKSGKIGFSGLTVMGLFFLTRVAIALTFNGVLSFVGDIDALVSGVLAFISFFIVYNLSARA